MAPGGTWQRCGVPAIVLTWAIWSDLPFGLVQCREFTLEQELALRESDRMDPHRDEAILAEMRLRGVPAAAEQLARLARLEALPAREWWRGQLAMLRLASRPGGQPLRALRRLALVSFELSLGGKPAKRPSVSGRFALQPCCWTPWCLQAP
ncbi:unnamed protein product [Prorocentrum cordatum]|uniref:Uncharacterized protein n=1 Tax=Prorocentrum cordatum TaxID=2364126 RepID=A0ABN9TRM1_9DINO|nr:unnamed protein product [Polarella glacialis]